MNWNSCLLRKKNRTDREGSYSSNRRLRLVALLRKRMSNGTGVIGPIKILRHEKYKGGSRVHFVCDFRAVRDHQPRQR